MAGSCQNCASFPASYSAVLHKRLLQDECRRQFSDGDFGPSGVERYFEGCDRDDDAPR